MITQCSYCQINTAGQHEYNCPMNTNNINNIGYIGGFDTLKRLQEYEELKNKKLSALCKLIAKIYEDYYNKNSTYFTDEVKELLEIIKEE